MGNGLADTVGTAINQLTRETAKNVSKSVRKRSLKPLAGSKGVAAGAGLVALAPLAVKGAKELASGLGGNGAGPLETAQKKAGEKLSGAVKGTVKDAVPSVGDTVKSALPGGGGDKGGKSEGQPGVGSGRRMPVQQSADIGVPLQTVYNQFTQFEEWPEFMQRVQQVSQEDETHIVVKAKIWGISREFTAEIEEQRPEERIKWRVSEGITHTGVVTFHELAPRLTRVEVTMDVEPGSVIEKAARGMRHVKRAIRADLARFKAYVTMQEEETGEWRGEIEDAEVKRRRSGASRSSSRSRSGSSSGRASSGAGSRSRSVSGRSGGSSGRSTRASSRSGGSSGRSTRASSRSGGSSGRSTRASSRSGGSSGRSTRSRARSGGASSRASSSGAGSRPATTARSGSSSSSGRRASSGRSPSASGSRSGRKRSSSRS